MNKFVAQFLLCALFAIPAAAIELGMPVDCAMGTDCVVQNFVDHDSETGENAYYDFACKQHSNDGHKGTDIRAVDHVVMERGVPVLAVADGMVLGFRDGVEAGAESTDNTACGNGVRLGHKGGWVTQYCHMRKGSVQVKKGQMVKTGEQIGLIGLTGSTVFPHVHLGVEKNGVVIDPYTGTPMGSECGATDAKPLWSAAAAKAMAFAPTGLLGAGFTNRKPEYSEMQKGLHSHKKLSGEDPILLFWVDIYGGEKGDKAYIALQDPDGMTIIEQTQVLERGRATEYYTAGKIKRDGPWPQGRYRGVFTLTRDNKPFIEREYSVDVGS